MMKEKMARWHVLYFHYLRRDWKKILIWVLVLGGFSGGYVPAFQEMAKGQGLVGMFETLKNPAMISMVGPTPIKEAGSYTLGAMYAHEMLLFCGLFAMIITGLHVVSHTRKEEDQGLLELIRSFQVGRQANSLAVMMEVLTINLALVIVTGAMMISFQADTVTGLGSWLFGLSVGGAGMIGGIIALVMAQIFPSSGGATGSTLGIIGLLYILRGATDVSNPDISMINPMGWTYMTYPFTENRFYPILYILIFVCLLSLIAFWLEGGRDMGAGYLPSREGRPYARKSLLSLPGLFLRLNRGLIISWQIAFLILGAAYGSIYGDMQTFMESNQLIQAMFVMTGISIEASFTSIIMMVMMGLVCILPIAIINKLFADEERQFFSQLYASQITRTKLFVTSLLIAFGSGVLGIFMAAYGLGATGLAVMDGKSTMELMDFIKAGYNYLPAVLFFIGLSSFIIGWKPGLRKMVYVYLGYSFAINYFGNIVELPQILYDVTVLRHITRMPVEAFEAGSFTLISIISCLLIGLGYIGYIRRDRIEGA